MAKRWLQAKRLKQKKYREKGRGVMKRYSSECIKAGTQPNPEVMTWYKNAARGLQNGNISDRELAYWNSNLPRQEALDLRKQLKNACPEWLRIVLVDNEFLRARLYFQFSPERCCVVILDKETGSSRRSVVYRNRDVAYQRWESNTLTWVDPSALYHPNIPETFQS